MQVYHSHRMVIRVHERARKALVQSLPNRNAQPQFKVKF